MFWLQMFMQGAVEGSTLWLLAVHKLSSPHSESHKCWGILQWDTITLARSRRYLSLICFPDTRTHTNTRAQMHRPFHPAHRYEGGRWWMAHISWVERQERVKWTVLVLGSMYAHTLLYFYRGQRKNLGYSPAPFLCVLSWFTCFLKGKSIADMGCTW